jgi:membrane AbrB-like protein
LNLISTGKVLSTLLLALAAAGLFEWLHTPLPWMLGPLVATGVASVLGMPSLSWNPLRNAGQCTIGVALGLYFTPQVGLLILNMGWAIAIGVLCTLGMGWVMASWLHRMHHLNRATTWFASAIGGASEMTLLAERAHGRTDLVAAAHSVRILIVTLVVPFGMQFSGLHGLDVSTPQATREFYMWGLLGLGALAASSAWLMQRLDRANPWFLGPLLAAMLLTLLDLHWSTVPQWMTNAAQLLIGVSLGVRFTPNFIHTAPKWLLSVALGTVGLIVMCIVLAMALAWGTGLHPATLVLGTAPGGIAEMAITAKVLQLGAPVVTAFQVCRLMTVLVMVGPMFRWLYAEADTANP